MGGNVNSVWAEHKQLKKDIRKMESSATGTVHKKDRYQAMADLEAHTASMAKRMQHMGEDRLRRFQMEGMSEQLTTGLEQEQAQLNQNIVKLNEKEKKQSDREKDAAARLGEQPAYFERSEESLKEARLTVLSEVKNDELTTTVREITGDEFALEPDGSMQGSIEDLLRHRMALAKVVQRHSKPEQESGDNVLYAKYNIELLKRMDEAIGFFYESNGVDFANGKSVGSMRKKRARKKFALAMESYRDLKKNMDDYLYTEKLKEIKSSAGYKARMKEMEKADLAQGKTLAESIENHRLALRDEGEGLITFANQLKLNPTNQQEVLQIRDMLREHTDKYQENKEVVDKLYVELLDYLLKLDRTQNKRKALDAGLRANGGTELEGISAKVQHRLENDEFLKEEGRLASWIENLRMSISYLLENKLPQRFSDHIFLADHCGITTDLFRQANRDLESMEKMQELGKTDEWISERLDRIAELRQAGKTYGQIADMIEYEDFRREEEQKEAKLRTDLAFLKMTRIASGDETDREELEREIENAEAIEIACQKVEGVGNKDDAFVILKKDGMFDAQNAKDFVKSREMAKQILGSDVAEKYRYTTANGSRKNKYRMDAAHRDAVSNVSPIGHPGECEIEKLERCLDNIDILVMEERSYLAVQMADKQEYQVRFQIALIEELDFQAEARKEVVDFLEAKGWENIRNNLPMSEIIQKYKEVAPAFEKSQGFICRADAMMKKDYFKELPLNVQREISENNAFFSAVCSSVNQLTTNFGKRAIGEEEVRQESLQEMMAANIQKNMQYISEEKAGDSRGQYAPQLDIVKNMYKPENSEEERKDVHHFIDMVMEEKKFETEYRKDLEKLRNQKAEEELRDRIEALEKEITLKAHALETVDKALATQFDTNRPTSILRRRAMLENPERAQWHTESRAKTHRIMGSNAEEKYKDEKGLAKFDQDVLQRDVASNIAPLGRPGDCTLEQMEHQLENINLLIYEKESVTAKELKKDKDGNFDEEAYQARFRLAIDEEFALQKSSKEEMQAYMQENGLLGEVPGKPDIAEVARLNLLTTVLFEKCQGLAKRSARVMRKEYFRSLPLQKQREFQDYAAFQNGLFNWALLLSQHYNARTLANANDYEDLTDYQAQYDAYKAHSERLVGGQSGGSGEA